MESLPVLPTERNMPVVFHTILEPFEEKTLSETVAVVFKGTRLIVRRTKQTKWQRAKAFLIHFPWAVLHNLRSLLSGEFYDFADWVPQPPGPPVSILGISVADDFQFATTNAVPSDVFLPGDSPRVTMSIARPGTQISLVVRNESSKAQAFDAMIIGTVLSP